MRAVFIEGTRFVSRKSFSSERINEMVHKWIRFGDNGDISLQRKNWHSLTEHPVVLSVKLIKSSF